MSAPKSSKTVHPLHEFYLPDAVGKKPAIKDGLVGWNASVFQSSHKGAIYTGEAKTQKGKGIHVRVKVYSPRYRPQPYMVASRLAKLGYDTLGEMSGEYNKDFRLPDSASPLPSSGED